MGGKSAASMQQIWFTDCQSVHDALVNPTMSKMADKRLSIEIASLRQNLWRQRGEAIGDPTYAESLPNDPTDTVRWVDTHVMIADPLTKTMEPTKMQEALNENYWNTKQPIQSVIEKQAKSLARRKGKGETKGSS